MTPLLISCIVPVFNGERYLGEAIDSILAQTYRPVEIIVVDDGSTDGTAAVAARYGDRIRYVRQNNGGAPTARNLGLSVAMGEFVAFLDSDDLWHPEKLQRQMACFEARADLDLCVTHLQRFWVPQPRRNRNSFSITVTRKYCPVCYRDAPGAALALRLGQLFRHVPARWGSYGLVLRAGERGAVVELCPTYWFICVCTRITSRWSLAHAACPLHAECDLGCRRRRSRSPSSSQ
jgi:glycosyltransferase involved in cell wall biosynthesis